MVRVDRDSRSYLRRGDAFLRQENTAEAMFYWKVAVSMYVPFASAPREAAERLLAAGEAAIRKGEREEGARAFRHLRSALLSVRHVRQPMPELLARAEERLKGLEGGPVSGESEAASAAPRGISTASIPLLAVGMAGWPWTVIRGLRRWAGGTLKAIDAVLPPLFLLLLAAGVWLA